jgi:hypothetical protein
LKTDLKGVSYNNSFIVFGLPIMTQTCDEIDKLLSSLQYPIGFIQFHLLNNVNQFLCMNYESYKKPDTKEKIVEKSTEKKALIRKEQVFIVKPDIQDDIYHLYAVSSESTEEKCGTAHIADYETSVMMNKIFRIIKENVNLDALEESDDEEEFENEQVDKFVKLNMSQKMVCHYNYKFKRWVPLKIATNNTIPISVNDLKNLQKMYENNKRRY